MPAHGSAWSGMYPIFNMGKVNKGKGVLRRVRVALAAVMLVGVTLLFVDFSGWVHPWLGWMAKIQLLPAVMAANLVVIAALVVTTLLLGRVYCSVVCPLGVMQDCVTHIGGMGAKKRRYRFTWSPAVKWLRFTVLALFVLAIVLGIGSFVALLAPYSSYGRIAQNLLGPIWGVGNNALADVAEDAGSYAFAHTEVWVASWSVFAVAAVTFVVLAVLAWRNGRTYCNTVCPVGTVLGYLARFSLLKPVIDVDKCNSCGLCGKACKASCINSKAHEIDYTRCVACMDCIDTCAHGAIEYRTRIRTKKEGVAPKVADPSRRTFMAIAATAGATAAIRAQEKTVDGGLAAILDKKVPHRNTHIVPPGALSLKHMAQHCTGCQLCVAVCPSDVLRPSGGLVTLMQPESSYERGYCRPECVKCSEVCPAGAITRITPAEKSAIRIGHAVWVKENCVVLTDGVECGNCARHCPAGAITMVPSVAGDKSSRKIPVVIEEYCLGCGACENLCPARPFSAIYVEGLETHQSV